MSFNFNVGDVIVDLSEMYLWDNIYHWEKNIRAMKPVVVKKANKDVFSTFDDAPLQPEGFGYGFLEYEDERKIYLQRTGRRWDGSGFGATYGNLTNNRVGVEAHIKKLYDEAKAKALEEDAADIVRMEKQIAALQRQINNVKEGGRTYSYNSAFVVHKFLDDSYGKMLEAIA